VEANNPLFAVERKTITVVEGQTLAVEFKLSPL